MTDAPVNNLVRIAERYWIVRNQWATVVGIVISLDAGSYVVHMDGQLPTTLANLHAVTEFVCSDRDHTIDLRISDRELIRYESYI